MSHHKKIALVTGGNTGIGFEIARQLAEQKITVVIGARDPEKGKAVASKLSSLGLDVHFVKLDVINPDDVATLPAYFQKEFGGLDILVNNAGIWPDKGQATTVDSLKATFEVNVFAPFAITEALLPLLKASPAGRIVNHSSGLGSLERLSKQVPTERLSLAYSSSKAALNAITVITARKLGDTKIKVNAAHPGWIKTKLGGSAATFEPEFGARTAVRLATLPDAGPTAGFFHLEETLPW